MATLLLQRRWETPQSTIGELSLAGKFLCYILEDAVRAVKIKAQTAIPPGRYKIVITPSQRFNRALPLLLDVPNYAGVRIHPGNTAADTEGCLLPGSMVETNRVLDSRTAFNQLFSLLRELLMKDEVWIEITPASDSKEE